MHALVYGWRGFPSDIRDGDDEQKPDPGLHVEKCLPDVIPPPLARYNTHLVGAQALDGDDFLALIEELGFHGGVGHEYQNDYRVENC